ncbi:MAG TPA: hypothetical protein VGJ03_12020 [Acidimicrobiales bacterium]|jgi:hypothetical protein
MADVVERYLELGLRLGRLLDGLVDAYYGPPDLARRVAAEPPPDPGKLAADARRLIADLDSGEGGDGIDAHRRRWIRGQVRGLLVTARRFAGETIGFVDEVEECYGVRPTRVDDDEIAAAQHRIDAVLPGTGPLGERLIAWREQQAIPSSKLDAAIHSLADDFRERTQLAFGLPDGERIDFELVSNEPWSGFNYYLGDLRSRVAINTDLPTLSTSLGHLVAHEAYPGHHTEHCRKEVGLVRRQGHLEETIFLVGTPQCLLAEGLADLGLEVIVPEHRHETIAAHLRPLGITYDVEIATAVEDAGELLGNAVRGNVSLALHDQGMAPDDAIAYVERFGLVPRNRAEKAVEFQTDPTWRAYIFCYIDGLRLCRRYVDGRPERFARLVTEPLLPEDLAA